jgi:hypothetical protein
MGFLFKAPKVKVPKAETPAPAPTIDDTVRQRTESDRLRRRRGSQGNIMTGPLGASIPAGNTPVKQLTGQ